MPAWVGQTGLGQAWSLEDKIREGGWLAEVECDSALGQPGQRRREKQETKTGNLGKNRKKDEENGNGFAWCGDGVRGAFGGNLLALSRFHSEGLQRRGTARSPGQRVNKRWAERG
ncbi:hypothetical protein E4U25_008232 [Claviceps purpurea]|nr:hypothetical protein E4U25_008232 [Claviceps purpurea]KAG6309109.1 hypothetical protein E4U45_000021 [Claviceps purpurea]